MVYIVVLFGRLILSAGSMGDRWEDLLWPVVIMLIAWAVLWVVSSTYADRRAKKSRYRV